jgi:transcriptional regulator with XRE-family HTH domain
VEIAVAFGRAVKARRVELGLSQEELVERARSARSFISGVEQGTKAATIKSVWKIAVALNCRPSDLWKTAERLHDEAR